MGLDEREKQIKGLNIRIDTLLEKHKQQAQELLYGTPAEIPQDVSEQMEEENQVIHPDHYADGGIETIDYICAKCTPEEFQGACKSNVIRYISRAGKKGPAQKDIAKAFCYLGWWYASLEGVLGVDSDDQIAPSLVIADLDLATLAEAWKTEI